jgi:sulfur carrier protein ThiS
MLVVAKLLLTFEEKTPSNENEVNLELPPRATVALALKALSIPESAPKVIVVNGRVADPALELSEGDRLTVFPPLEGG